MKKTILYVITQGEWGGAQRYVYDLASNLKDNFEVIVAIGETEGRKDLQDKFQITNDKLQTNIKYPISNIKIIQLKHLVRNISPIHDVLTIFELAKLYKTLKPDIIHLNSSKAGIIGSLAARCHSERSEAKPRNPLNNVQGIPPLSARGGSVGMTNNNDRIKIIYTVHGWVFNEPSRKLGRWLYCWLEKFTARWKDKIIVLSDRDFDDGVKAGIDKTKLVKIPLGIEMPKFLDKTEAREKIAKLLTPTSPYPLLGQEGKTWIGTIANLYKTKGLDVLVEAVKILTQRDPSTSLRSAQDDKKNYVFFVIGEGPERKNLELRIMNYELEDTVYLTGTIDNASQYLKAFDLFVLPSRKEGTPYTILEAMAAELPIVATDAGGIKELVPNTIAPENPDALAMEIIKTIKNPTSIKKNTSSLEKMLGETKDIYSSF